MKFVWDANKADSNRRKHGVTFDEATTVFGDPLAGTFEDADHSLGERRLIRVVRYPQGACWSCPTRRFPVRFALLARRLGRRRRPKILLPKQLLPLDFVPQPNLRAGPFLRPMVTLSMEKP
jgi:uncharacterized protein